MRRDELDGRRLLAAPWFTVAWVDAAGRPRLAGDRAAAPFTPPAAPGLAAPLVGPGRAAWVAADGRGGFVVTDADLPYLMGPWLADQLAAARPGPYARASAAPPAAPEAAPEAGPLTRLLGLQPARVAVPTLFPGLSPPLVVRLDGDALARDLAPPYALALGAWALVTGAFAAALAIAQAGVRRALAQAAERANFTAMVSHELKTPIAAVRLHGEALAEGLITEPAQVARYHRTIVAEAGRLQRLVEDLLDLGRIERGARRYALAPHDLNALVEAAVAQARTLGPDADLTLDLAPGLAPVRADADAGRQAIANVVHNALKYGGGRVTVRTRPGRVEVADAGPGIPADRRAAVFEPYVRLGDEDRREAPGTGLGLALVKGYMAGQGGAVSVAAAPGGGSLFTLRFEAADEVMKS